MKEKIKDLIVKIIVIVCLLVFFIQMILGIHYIKIDGNSMYPNIKNHQLVMTTRLIGSHQTDYHRGDVITFNAYGVDPRAEKGQKYIKRIIGVPGDTVSFNGKEVLINGKPENKVIHQDFSTDQKNSGVVSLTDGNTTNKWNFESLSKRKFPDGLSYWNSESIGHLKVPQGCYFVMGDNRKISNDSREFGFVPANHIVGRSIFQ